MSETSWIFGFHSVEGALSSGAPIDLVLLQDGRRSARSSRILGLSRAAGISFRFVSSRKLEELAGGVAHNGFAARSAPVQFRPLEECIPEEGQPSRMLLVDAVSDPHNLGAVIRSAAAFAVDALIIAGPSAPPLEGAVAKAAAGHLYRVPLVRTKVAADSLRHLAGEGYWILGAESSGSDLSRWKSCDRWVLCMGSEAKGLRAKTRSQIDEYLAIPMAEGVESLNLSVATGILLYALSTAGLKESPVPG